MKEVYLLSGLGADRRVFSFLDLQGYKINYIDWIEPDDNESIEGYASRLLVQIPSENPILIGVSFGGMMAIEIGKLIETEKIILISSAATKSDIPFYFRITGWLRLDKLIPKNLFKRVNGFTYRLFGTTTPSEKELLKKIIEETDSKFLAWGIHRIANWKNLVELKNTVLIHGTNDKIFPGTKQGHKIIDGGHLMIVNRGPEISELILKILNQQ